MTNDIKIYIAILTRVDVGSEKALQNDHSLKTLCEDLPEVSIDFTNGGSIRAVIFCSLLNNKFYKSSKGYFFIFFNQV